MATVIGGIGISHTPSMGIEYDRGTASPDGFSPRWRPWYDGTRRVEELENLPGHLDELVSVPVREYMRLGGTEAAELTLWFTMRAALSQRAAAVYTFQTFPAITGCGALVMAEPGALPGTGHSTGLAAVGAAQAGAAPGSGSEAGS